MKKKSLTIMVLFTSFIFINAKNQTAYYSRGPGHLYRDIKNTVLHKKKLKPGDLVQIIAHPDSTKDCDGYSLLKIKYKGKTGYIRDKNVIIKNQEISVSHIKTNLPFKKNHFGLCLDTRADNILSENCTFACQQHEISGKNTLIFLYWKNSSTAEILDAVSIKKGYRFMHATYHKHKNHENCFYIAKKNEKDTITNTYGFIRFDKKRKKIFQADYDDIIFLNPT